MIDFTDPFHFIILLMMFLVVFNPGDNKKTTNHTDD